MGRVKTMLTLVFILICLAVLIFCLVKLASLPAAK